MVFSSLNFIFIFLPIFILCYYVVPYKLKNGVLLFGSLMFYTAGTVTHPEHLVLLLCAVLVDFLVGIGIERYEKYKKIILGAGVLYHLFWLFCFKYAGFVFSLESIILPVGISFYTFQGISYIADVYKKRFPAEKSILNVGVYISMFPQLIAGPIVTYPEVRERLYRRKCSKEGLLEGIGMFVFGLGLKVLLANRLGGLWEDVQTIGFDSISTPLAWMSIFAFTFQLYFDFFGYSVMAIGLGKMLGFKLPVNFSHPYMSRSMTEFWRNWHITLGRWFREYVYIPLGGNRKGKLITYRNLLIVWLLAGIWHGAGYNFILWGAVLFVLIALEKSFVGKFLERHPLVGHAYMLVCIPLTWAVFAITDISQIGVFFSRLFPFFGQRVWSIFRYDYVKYADIYGVLLLVGLLFSTRLPYKLMKRIKSKVIIFIILTAIFAGSVYCMWLGLNDPFLYFRF